MQILKLKKE